MKGLRVNIHLEDSPGGVTSGKEGRQGAKTGADGVATFEFPKGIPPFIAVDATFDAFTCSQQEFRTKEVLQTGIVADNHCDQDGELKVDLVPARIVIFARRLTFWEKLKNAFEA